MQIFIRERNFEEISESGDVCQKEGERLHEIIKIFVGSLAGYYELFRCAFIGIVGFCN
jgi:hypothetical protein